MLENVVHAPSRQAQSLSVAGLALGTLFFAASLTPSLIPRNAFTQGALAGSCFAIGYGLDVFLRWLWRYLEFPELAPRTRRIATIVTAVLGLAIAVPLPVVGGGLAEFDPRGIRHGPSDRPALLLCPPSRSRHSWRFISSHACSSCWRLRFSGTANAIFR